MYNFTDCVYKMDSLSIYSEYETFQTFWNWPVDIISATSMGAAGFYYLLDADGVRCAFCNVG